MQLHANICSYINIPEACQLQALCISLAVIAPFLLHQSTFQSRLAEGASSMQQWVPVKTSEADYVEGSKHDA